MTFGNHQALLGGTILFFDHPSAHMFTESVDINDNNRKFKTRNVFGKTLEIREVANKEYFVRPPQLLLGYNLSHCKFIFTTSERLIEHLIQRKYPNVYTPKLVPDEKLDAGDITMVKTKLVTKKVHGLLLPIIERPRKEGHKFNYIANGQGVTHNLVSSRGNNTLDHKDAIIKVSQPHIDQVIRMCNEMGWDRSSWRSMKVILALDAMGQAIGRNGAYRWSDKEPDRRRKCIALVDRELFKALYEQISYGVNETMSWDEDVGGKVKKDYDTLLAGLEWYVRNHVRDMTTKGSGRGAKTDFERDCIDAINKAGRLKTFVSRQLNVSMAIGTKIKAVYSRAHKALLTKTKQVIDQLGPGKTNLSTG
jgi:hypothetical protein